MNKSSFIILFEDPFWRGLYERVNDGRYEVCKITFVHELKAYEVCDFLLRNWHKLQFSPPVKANDIQEQNKIERKTISLEQKEWKREHQFALRKEKKKAKHKGR